jgi:hypothetical protein
MTVIPFAAYVVVGTVEVCVPIPPGYRIVGLSAGRKPHLMPLPRESRELVVEGVEWDTLSDKAMEQLPVVLLVMRNSDAIDTATMAQDDADEMHSRIILEWAQDTSAGYA